MFILRSNTLQINEINNIQSLFEALSSTLEKCTIVSLESFQFRYTCSPIVRVVIFATCNSN